MAIGIQTLRTVARRATPIAIDIYDKALLPVTAFAQRLRIPGQRTVSLEWWEAFPQMVEWIGDRKTQDMFGSSITIDTKPFEVTYKLDRMEAELDEANLMVTKPQEMGAAIANAFLTGPIEKVVGLLRSGGTALSYDGQFFFDTDHTQPDATVYSNIVDLSDLAYSRAATGKPTVDEARRELNLAVQRLQVNRLRRTTVMITQNLGNLMVICHSLDTWLAYQQLRDEPSFVSGAGSAVMVNPWMGKFELALDTAPVSGDEKKVDVIMGEAGGLMPVIFNEARGPRGIEFDESDVFSSRIIFFGSDALYGFALGFPQGAVRIQE